jgi:hypothetical protein
MHSPRRFLLMMSCLSTFPVSAWAEDPPPDNELYIADPSFLPRQGHLYFDTTYGYSNYRLGFQPTGDVVNEHITVSRSSIDEDIAYGITSRLSVSGSVSYVDSTEHYTFLFGPPNESAVHQFDNPTAGLVYRTISQPSSGFSVDTAVTVAPKVIDDDPGFERLDVLVNQRFNSLTIQGELSTFYSNSFTTSRDLSRAAQDVSGQWGYAAAGRGRLRLNPQWTIYAGIVYSRDFSNSDFYPAFDQRFNYGPLNIVDPYVELAFDVVPGHVNLAFEYDCEFFSDQQQSGAASGTYINQPRSIYSVHLRVRL